MILKCKYCSRTYMVEWAKKNHERLCGEKQEAIKKNPGSYSGGKRK